MQRQEGRAVHYMTEAVSSLVGGGRGHRSRTRLRWTPWAILQFGLYPEGSRETVKGFKQGIHRLGSAF